MADSKDVPKKPSKTKAGETQNKPKEGESSSGSSVSNSDEEEKDADQIGKNVAKGSIVIDREEYLLAHRELTFDRNQLQVKNNILHRRLAEYYKKRKLDHVLKALEASQDMEEKYQQKLFSYQEMKEKEEIEIADINAKVQAVHLEYTANLEEAEKKFDELQDHERNTGSGLVYSKKGKIISEKTVARFLSLQRSKTKQASAMNLKYIRLRNAVAEKEAIVRQLERIGPGLYVAQYEQLRVDKLNYTSKSEERDDELIKNRMKCTEHNQILAHIREKMHHTDEVIDITECDLGDAEIDFQRAREDLSLVKTRRDKLRWSLEAEGLKAGLLTKKDLLRDYQDSVDMVIKLKERKERLQNSIARTNTELRQARRCMTYHNENKSSDNSENFEDNNFP